MSGCKPYDGPLIAHSPNAVQKAAVTEVTELRVSGLLTPRATETPKQLKEVKDRSEVDFSKRSQVGSLHLHAASHCKRGKDTLPVLASSRTSPLKHAGLRSCLVTGCCSSRSSGVNPKLSVHAALLVGSQWGCDVTYRIAAMARRSNRTFCSPEKLEDNCGHNQSRLRVLPRPAVSTRPLCDQQARCPSACGKDVSVQPPVPPMRALVHAYPALDTKQPFGAVAL
eukprot:6492726-Amphidinium_carterae.2